MNSFFLNNFKTWKQNKSKSYSTHTASWNFEHAGALLEYLNGLPPFKRYLARDTYGQLVGVTALKVHFDGLGQTGQGQGQEQEGIELDRSLFCLLELSGWLIKEKIHNYISVNSKKSNAKKKPVTVGNTFSIMKHERAFKKKLEKIFATVKVNFQ